MGKCVVRILEEWEILKTFYQTNVKDKKEMILKMFEDPLSKPKIQFLNYFLQNFNGLNLLYQNDNTLSHYLCDHLRIFLKSC